MSTGGVPSSLSSLYNYIQNRYDVSVFALSHEGGNTFSYSNVLLPEYALSRHFFSSWKSLKGIEKLKGLFWRILKVIDSRANLGLESFVCNRIVNYINNQCHYDVIISFQDRVTAKVCQYFDNSRKIAWIHCDYPRIMGEAEDELMFQKYEKIVCVSSYTAERFKQRYKSVAGKVSFIYNIVDYNRIIENSKADVGREIINNKTFVIVSVGRLSHLKRFYLIPKIASTLKKNGCLFMWYVIGGGEKDEEMLIKKNISKYGVEDSVSLLGNQLNPYSYMLHSDLLVSLSETEACPMIFIEARTLGVPVVSADFGSSYEFISNNKDGIIRSIESIDVEIMKMIRDKEYYNYYKKTSNTMYIDNSVVLQDFDNLITL